MAPFDLTNLAGTVSYALVFGLIGFGFGAALELSGFGDTRKLAAQFYFRDLTVLKVMFTAIVVAAVLVTLSSAFGLLDLSRVWVNPTYLWPGIVGGLVMGVGFVIGGFCPGTSVVAASTLKVDGMLFLGGVLAGVWLFGETVGSFEPFFLSSFMGRFTLPEWLGLSAGGTLLLVVAQALAMFWGAEILEQRFGQGEPWARIRLLPRPGLKLAGASALVSLALVAAVRGQPSAEEKWTRARDEVRRAVDERTIFVDPAEVVSLRKDLSVQVSILDLRSEHDFNLFHLGGSRRLEGGWPSPATVKALLAQPASTVTFLVGNGEAAALAAWKALKVEGVSNLYVIEGGFNRWLDLYPAPACVGAKVAPAAETEAPAFRFAYATGSSLPAAWPELPVSRGFRSPCGPAAGEPGPHAEASHAGIAWPNHPFTKRVKLQAKAAVKGGCG